MVVEIECLQNASVIYVDQSSDMFKLLSKLIKMTDEFDPIDFKINIKGSIYHLRIDFFYFNSLEI